MKKDESILQGFTEKEKAWIKDGNLQLTDADKALLQEFLQALDVLDKKEPEKLSSTVWDQVWPAIQATGEVPEAYRDRIGIKDVTVYDTIDENGNYKHIPQGVTRKSYFDIVWESWNDELYQLTTKYNDTIKKAILYAIKNDNKIDENMPLDEFLLRFMPNPFTDNNQERAITNNLFSSPYLPMLNGSLVNDIMQLNTRGMKADPFTKKAVVFTKDGHKLTINNFDKLLKALSTPAKKLVNTAIMYLTNVNYYRSHNITPTVEIPLVAYGEACGYQLTPRKMATKEEQTAEDKAVKKRIREFQKEVKGDLRDITAVQWTAEETKGRNKGDYADMTIISSHRITNGLIRINFDIDAANYLVNSYVMQHPIALLKIDNRNPNAYALGVKIAQHYSNDNNAIIGTNNTLSVKSLIAAAPEIQTIEELQARGQRNWKDKIKRPLESSLDLLIKVGVFSRWEYRDPANGNIYNSESAQPLTWTQYSALMVDFIMKNEPDQTKRRTAKSEAKLAAAANKEKKEVKKRGALKGTKGGS